MTPQHWLVAYRRAENARTAPGERKAEEKEEVKSGIAGLVSRPIDRFRREHVAWMIDSLARVYGYASLEEMCGRVAEGPRWYDVELESMVGRNLCPWGTRQLIRFHAGSLVPEQTQEAGSSSSSTPGHDGSEEGSDAEDSPSSDVESSGSDTPSSGHESNGGDTPSSTEESDDGDASSSTEESDDGDTPFTSQALQSASYNIEDHTLVLYQDLMSLFRCHIDAGELHSQAASVVAHTEMDILMSRYEYSLAEFTRSGSNNSIPAHLYSGMSERIRQCIVYRAYIASDRAYFPTSPWSAVPWSYLGPKKYLASRLRRQRISSEMLMVFQNKRALLRELKSVAWGRRRYLRWLERYPEVIARVLWMFDPTFTHTRVEQLDSRVGTLEG